MKPVFSMTAIILFITCLVLGHAGASQMIELNCSDNATCIENMIKEFVRNVRQQKSVKLFDVLTVEPLKTREARSYDGLLSNFLKTHAFSYDWGDWTFRISKPEDRNDVLNLEIYESRTAKDVSEEVPKKSYSNEVEEDKTRKRRKKRKSKKVLQAVIPLVVGMKSAGVVIFALTAVAILTLKAFLASKLALLVTVGMAVKKFYENYSHGVGLQNHPYLYSQYPIDFPSATSHAYSVSGVNPQFGAPQLYDPHADENKMLVDTTAQQSQQTPTLAINNTRAIERWDGYRRRPMFYGTSRASSDSYSAYQDYRHSNLPRQ